MYNYSFTLAYAGNDPFISALWLRITRGTGIQTFTFQWTPAQAAAARTSATNAGFNITNITRIPVAPDPEVVA